jgi:hypothetical protein
MQIQNKYKEIYKNDKQFSTKTKNNNRQQHCSSRENFIKSDGNAEKTSKHQVCNFTTSVHNFTIW